MTETEVAWLAGLLEGESYLGMQNAAPSKPGRRPFLVVAIEMCDRDVIERAAALMGNNAISVRQPLNPQYSILYGTKVQGKKAQQVMQAILPYMGKRRSDKIRKCLATPNLSHHPKEKI